MHNDYYIYLHKRNDTGQIFYVGKGRKERATNISGRSDYWKNVYEKAGGRTVHYLYKNLTNQEALDLEKNVILTGLYNYFPLVNLCLGGPSTLGWKPTEETKQNISNALSGKYTGKKGTRYKGYYVGTSIADGSEVIYYSANSAKADGFQSSKITLCANGKRNSHNGYTWKLVDDTREVEPRKVSEGHKNPPILKGKDNPQWKGCIEATNIKTSETIILECLSDGTQYGFDYKKISLCCLGKRPTHKGYTFKQHVSQSINKNNVKSQRPGGMNYR